MLIPKIKSEGIILNVPRETTFELPEGNYAATIDRMRKFMKQTKHGAQEWVRVLFDVDIPSRSKFINMAGRSFESDLNEGSDLRNFLTDLLGRKYFQDQSGCVIDLESLVGARCELELIHFSNGKYEHPMVMVNRCVKPGTLNLTEQPVTTTLPVEPKGGKPEAK